MMVNPDHANFFVYCRFVEADPPWAKNLEWKVSSGITQVVFTARSPVSNDTATCTFKIHVVGMCSPFHQVKK